MLPLFNDDLLRINIALSLVYGDCALLAGSQWNIVTSCNAPVVLSQR